MGRFTVTFKRRVPHRPDALESKPWSFKKWCVLTGALITLACAVYVEQTNRLATKGYQADALRRTIEQLRRENRDLENRALRLQSLEQVASKISSLNLVPSSDVRYLPGAPTAMSRR